METQILLWLLAILCLLIGLAGLILPAVPGVPLIYGGLVLLAWAEDFAHVGGFTLALLGVLALISYGVDFIASALGSQAFGASTRAIWGAALGGGIGIFFGLPGLILGPFLGAVVAELSHRASPLRATRAGIGALLGLLFGALLKIALAFTMIGVFVLARLF